MRRSLLDYCERDTLALVELHRALRKVVSDTVSSDVSDAIGLSCTSA